MGGKIAIKKGIATMATQWYTGRVGIEYSVEVDESRGHTMEENTQYNDGNGAPVVSDTEESNALKAFKAAVKAFTKFPRADAYNELLASARAYQNDFKKRSFGD